MSKEDVTSEEIEQTSLYWCEACEKDAHVVEFGEIPSMAGYGVDWWIELDCGHTYSGHPDVS